MSDVVVVRQCGGPGDVPVAVRHAPDRFKLRAGRPVASTTVAPVVPGLVGAARATLVAAAEE